MQSLLAIAGVTLKAAFRFRLVAALAVLLVGIVLVIPLIIRDDGTARGFTQIILTYTLTVITGLLGMATLWLACGTLAREIEECQIQVLAVKPVPRWKIWMGKWLGIMGLNTLMLLVSGGCVYGLLLHKSNALPPAEQMVLKNEVLVARAGIREVPPDIEADVELLLKERLKDPQIASMDRAMVRKQIREQVIARQQVVPSGYVRRWQVKLGAATDFLQGQPLYLRVKFFVPPEANSTLAPKNFEGLWEVGPPDTTKRVTKRVGLAADTYHEFPIPADLFDKDGVLTVDYQNHSETAILFPLGEGLEVLYQESGFPLNFARGLAVILCWMGLLAALGLAAASFLSFPVAAFMSLGILTILFSGGTISAVVQEGTIMGISEEGGPTVPSALDAVAVPAFKAVLQVINLVQGVSPIDSLSSGRSITWSQLAGAFGQIILLFGGFFALAGISILSRRELASAQHQQ